MTKDEYLAIIDQLRAQRSVSGWKPENDRALLACLEDGYHDLSEEDRAVVESQGGRSWPDWSPSRS